MKKFLRLKENVKIIKREISLQKCFPSSSMPRYHSSATPSLNIHAMHANLITKIIPYHKSYLSPLQILLYCYSLNDWYKYLKKINVYTLNCKKSTNYTSYLTLKKRIAKSLSFEDGSMRWLKETFLEMTLNNPSCTSAFKPLLMATVTLSNMDSIFLINQGSDHRREHQLDYKCKRIITINNLILTTTLVLIILG